MPCSTDCDAGTFETAACSATEDRICGPCGSACPSGQWAAEVCHPLADRVCTNCITECSGETFESQACTPDQDRVCLTCADACDPGFFEELACTSVSDRECGACRPECDTDLEYESVPCTVSTDRVCELCLDGCSDAQFITAACTATADVICSDCSTCPEEAYTTATCTATTDTVCERCQDVCLNQTTAPVPGFGNYFEAIPCTPTSNRECNLCSETCPPETYRGAACNLAADLECISCSLVSPGSYETVPCTGMADREQSACTVCGEGEFEASACEGAQDRTCGPCRERCEEGTFQELACQATGDRVCTACSVGCVGDAYESVACTVHGGDRTCTPQPICAIEEYENRPASETAARECAACQTCAEGSYVAADCSEPGDRICQPITECAEFEDEIVAPTGTSDRRCQFNGLCSSATANLVFHIDASGSVGTENFQKILNISTQIIQTVTISPSATRVAAVLFENQAVEMFDFTEALDNAAAVAAINGIQYPPGNRATATAAGFLHLANVLFDNAKGYRSDVRTVVVTITDGRAAEGIEELREAVATVDAFNSVIRIAIGIQAFDPVHLSVSASSPRDLFTYASFDDFVAGDIAAHMGSEYIGCSAGYYEVAPCTTSSNRECNQCSDECPSGMYKTIDCNSTHDIGCSPCRNCDTLGFAVVPCTTESDRQCELCPPGNFQDGLRCLPLTECTSTEHAERPGTRTSDRVCSITTTCTSTEFEVSGPTATSDRECRTCRECDENSHEVSACTATEDRGCQVCSACPRGLSFQIGTCLDTGGENCATCTLCGPHQIAEAPCSADADTVCVDCEGCPLGSWSINTCTAVRDGTCVACHPECATGEGEFEAVPCTAATDRRCGVCSVGCRPDQYETPCNATNDLVCHDPTVCALGTEYEVRPPTVSTDRICLSLTPCNFEEQYIVQQPSAFTDYVCSPLTVCADGTTETTAPSPTSDRTCFFDGTCRTREEAYDLLFLLDGSGSVGVENFEEVKLFVRGIAAGIHNISVPGVRVGAIVFGRDAYLQFDFNAGTSAGAVDALLDSIRYPLDNQATGTANAIEYIAGEMLSPSMGFRQGRLFLVVVTDGPAGEGPELLSDALNALHAAAEVDIVAVGVGPYSEQELNLLAGNNPERSFGYRDFAALSRTADAVLDVAFTCPDGQFLFQQCSEVSDNICNRCANHCPAGQYITGTCGGTNDFTCSECSGECPEGEYTFTPCNGIHDRQCTPCSLSDCSTGQYVIGCSADSDIICQGCSVSCPAEHYRTANCTGLNDTRCTLCGEQCAVGFWESQPCTFDSDRQCRVCAEGCPGGMYEDVPCASTEDRTCAVCGAECPAGQYESTSCSSTSDRVCSVCSSCGEEAHETSPCTPSDDRTCTQCAESCTDGFFESSLCSPTTDRECNECRSNCDTGTEFESSPCSVSSDRQCGNCSGLCPDAQFITAECSAEEDRRCTACTECGPERFARQPCGMAIDTTCDRCSERCFGGAFEITSCTASTDRVCEGCEDCLAGQFVHEPCSEARNTQCSNCSTFCDDSTYTVQACSTIADRQCVPCTTCVVGEWTATMCTSDSDRVCAACSGTCDPASSYESTPCLPLGVLDRRCSTLTTCTALQFEEIGATPSSDRVCANLTVCDTGSQFIYMPPTATTDRGCQLRATCEEGVAFDAASLALVPIPPTQDRTCDLCSTTCPDGRYTSSPCTPEGDRVCSPCSVPCVAGATFEAADCRFDHDRLCTACSGPCLEGSWLSAACNAAQDRQCSACSELTAVNHTEVAGPRRRRSEKAPTSSPHTSAPTAAPTTEPSAEPTTLVPTTSPTTEPSPPPTARPSAVPTEAPTRRRQMYISGVCTPEQDATLSPVSECAAEHYELVAFTRTSDRVCSRCTDPCPTGTYFDGACSPTNDTSCPACSPGTCPASHFQSIGCTPSADRVCVQLSDRCDNAARYEVTAPTPTSDRSCAPLTQCGSGEYVVHEVTYSTDRLCNPVTSCQLGFEQSVPSTPTTDRQCRFNGLCNPCASDHYVTSPCNADNDNVCTRCREHCVHGFFEAAGCSQSSDRRCQRCSTPCLRGSFQSAACTELTDRQCTNCQLCAAGSFETVPCLTSSDTQCDACSSCIPGLSFETAACTATADRICSACRAPCSPGQFEAVSCTRSGDRVCETCTASCGLGQYETAPCSQAGSDTTCAPQPVCTTTQYESQRSTATSSRVCRDRTAACTLGHHLFWDGEPEANSVCRPCQPECSDPDKFESRACTLWHDRACSSCSAPCASHSFEIASCSSLADRVCQIASLCDGYEYESAPPGMTTDRICSQPTVCDSATYEHLPPTATTDRVCRTLSTCDAGASFDAAPWSDPSLMRTADRRCSPCSTTCPTDATIMFACSPDADRICAPCGPHCVPGVSFESAACSSDRDRECTPVTTCGTLDGGEEEASAPTLTSDRTCRCASGYRETLAGECVDVDECTEGNSACQQGCNNTIGSFFCTCVPGYTTSDAGGCDRISCGPPTAAVDATAIGSSDPLLFGQSATFTCREGYQTSSGDSTFEISCSADASLVEEEAGGCNNVDECQLGNSCEETCEDTPGSFHCTCAPGLTLNADGQTCNDRFDVLARSRPSFATIAIGNATLFEGLQPHGATSLTMDPFQAASAFTIIATFRQARSTGGYLLAKTNQRGDVRHLGLYLFKTKSAINFYYMPAGSLRSRYIQFPFAFPVNDGRWHRVMLSVDQLEARLTIDGHHVATRTLVGPVEDCANARSPDCVGMVGLRLSSDEPDRTNPFTGAVRELVLYLKTAHRVPPASVQRALPARTLSMLQPLRTGICLPLPRAGEDIPQVRTPMRFPGTYAVRSGITFDRSARQDAVFTLTATVQQTPCTRGYIFSRTSNTGALRYFALYSTGASMRLYYKAVGRPSTSRLALPGGIADGLTHRVMLAIDLSGGRVVARLSIDDAVVATEPLDGLIDLCSMDECAIFLGGRANGVSQTAHHLSGKMYAIKRPPCCRAS